MAGHYTCLVDFNVDDRKSSVMALVARLHALIPAQSGDRCEVDLRRCGYLGPDAVALLGATVLDLKHRGAQVTPYAPQGPKPLQLFWHASGMEALEQGATFPVQPHPLQPTDTTTAARQYVHASFLDADPIIALVRGHLSLSNEIEDALRTCVNEVLQNVQDHANSPVGGVVCARFIQRSMEVRVAIVDRGIGIRQSLSKRYPAVTRETALRWVISGSYSAQSRINNLGLGISNLCAIVEDWNGDIFLLSQDAIAERHRGKGWKYGVPNQPFTGTGVFFTLPIMSHMP